jgi:hypothetical protein
VTFVVRDVDVAPIILVVWFNFANAVVSDGSVSIPEVYSTVSESVPSPWKPVVEGGQTFARAVRHDRNGFYASREGSELGQRKKPTTGKPWAGSLVDG